MLRPHHIILLAALMADGGVATPPPSPSVSDAGPVTPQPISPSSRGDAGTETPPHDPTDISWPKDLRPLATLDGPAVLAANAVLQQVLSRFPKEYAGACEYSARSMQVVIGEENGLYFVRIDRRADKCGWPRGAHLEFDWFELYAVTPEGKVLARYPYMP